MKLLFDTPHQYVFYHESIKHLFLLWKKERKRELYVIEEEGDTMLLRYPGETYVDTVLHIIEPIFFQKLENEKEPIPIVLGATFQYNDMLVGMYYTPPHPQENLSFFEIKDEEVHSISGEEYDEVVQAFAKEYEEYVLI